MKKNKLYMIASLLFITLLSAGCNALEPSIDEKESNQARGSYSWWSNRQDEEMESDAYNSEFGDQGETYGGNQNEEMPAGMVSTTLPDKL